MAKYFIRILNLWIALHTKDKKLNVQLKKLISQYSDNKKFALTWYLVSELIPKLRFHYISLHWVSDYLPLSLNH